MTICPARVVVTVELRPDASSATANSSEASSRPSNGEQRVGLLDIDHLGVPVAVEHAGGDDQDRRVDQQRLGQRQAAVGHRPAQRLALAGKAARVGAALHQRGTGRGCAA